MKSSENVAIICQARLGSQRVPKKMVREFNSTTLIDILFEKINRSKVIPKEHFYFSVCEEETELTSIADKWEMNLFSRSYESAVAETNMRLIYEWHDKLGAEYTHVVLISACNPFLSLETMEGFYSRYLEIDSRGLFAVVQKKQYYWDDQGNIKTDMGGLTIMNTKLVENTFEAAHCLYASELESIKDGVWMGNMTEGDPELYMIESELEVFDIDYEWQFNMAKAYHKTRESKR